MNNRSLDRSRLNQSKLNRTKNQSIQEEDSIVQAWNDIETLRRENKLLKDEIEIETKMVKNNQTQDVSRVQKQDSSLYRIEEIQERSVMLASQIELESKKNRDLSLLLTISKEEIQENKLALTRADGNALPQLQAKQKSSEYQLEKIRGRQNESQAQINKFKEVLNGARRERVIFSNVFKKLECDLKKKDDEFKKQILERMKEDKKKQESEEDYQKTKDWAQEEIKKKQEKYEQALYEIEDDMENERQRIVETKHKIFETEVLEQKAEKAQNSSRVENSPGKIQNVNRSQTKQIEYTEKEVEQYRFMFAKLKRETGIDDTDEFIDQYKSIQAKNEELYNQCNEKSDRILELQKEKEEIESESKKYSDDQDMGNALSKQEQNAKKMNRQKRLQQSIKKANMQHKRMNKDIATMSEKVLKLAEFINVETPEEGIKGKNALKFISELEQKISLIINMAQFCQEEVKDIERKVQPKPKIDKDKEINECLDNIHRNKEAERIKNRADLEEVAFEAIRDFSKRRKAK